MKQLRKADLYQWLWTNLSSPVNIGTKESSLPLYAFAQIHHVQLPKSLPQWAKQFNQHCQKIEGTIRGATAYHILKEIDERED